MIHCIADLKRIYRTKKKEIAERLKGFKNLWCKGSEEDIFAELCFCLLTPQSKALSCWDAVCEIRGRGLFIEGNADAISRFLRKRTRFYKHKTGYIIAARKLFGENGRLRIREKIEEIKKVLRSCRISFLNGLREWLVRNVRGLGYKEGSHFLRNIGLVRGIAILDRHILKNLKALGVIKEIPHNLTKKKYLEIEQKMKKFSKGIGIPVEALDLLFWSEETGRIFK